MIITIECRINVDGTWWDVTTEHIVAPAVTAEKKVEYVKKIIRGMASVGLISRVAISTPPAGQAGKPPQGQLLKTDSAEQGDKFGPPHCSLHKAPMSASKVQKKEGHTEFYCRLKTGDGVYCKNRATVLDETGLPKFWSVK